MFNFEEELKFYEEALTVKAADSLSGDEVKDILDIVEALSGAVSGKTDASDKEKNA